ncbi:MAG TPA: hypothetical protein VHP32_04495 [Ignavibacteria bacterium]|nr:hypothetical protein [Ignavibacteria bacterium]
MESLLNPFGIWDSIFNSLGTALYTNIYFRFFVIGFFVGLFFLLIYVLKYKHRDSFKKIFIIVVPLFAICLFVVGKLYSRGYRIENIKQQGREIVVCLEQFKKINGHYPEKLSELVPSCVKNENVKNEKVFRYRLDDTFGFILSIKEDFMGSEYLRYDIRYKDFIFVD